VARRTVSHGQAMACQNIPGPRAAAMRDRSAAGHDDQPCPFRLLYVISILSCRESRPWP
jgi:hypothetical protein